MNDAQLHALDHGYTYGLLWVAGVAVIVGGAALFIGYTPDQVAHAQEVKEAIDAGSCSPADQAFASFAALATCLLATVGLPAVITRMSELFLRTLRDDPADAEVPSHKLLIRAGYVRPVAPGLYSWLPLGLRVLRNIERIVREEMNAIGGQEILFPALLPRAPYETTNRWTEYGDSVFRLKDRRGNDYLLGPTHEELFTSDRQGRVQLLQGLSADAVPDPEQIP